MGIVLLVVLGIVFSYGIGRALGLPHKLSVLVACGNSICGNSTIAAVAPVIRADKAHVASSIAFTAILGVVVVIGLPFLIQPLGLSFYQYGVLAGLTVYAVPQVLAAAFPVSVLSGQVGTLVKLVRVLMLGPVVLFFALIFFTWGEIFSLFPSTCTDAFGSRYATVNTSLLYTAKGTSALLVPFANTIQTATGSWYGVFVVAAGMNLLVVGLAVFALKPMRNAQTRRGAPGLQAAG